MGKPLTLLTAAAAILLAGCQSDARMRWVQIGNGPTLEYAQAQCNILAMGVGQNTFAVGSPGFVAGAAIGDAIATGIAQAELKKNCMVMQGWKQVPDVARTSQPHPPAATAKSEMSKTILAFGTANNQCIKGDASACKRKAALKAKLLSWGINPG
jgi:hypothetical protein